MYNIYVKNININTIYQFIIFWFVVLFPIVYPSLDILFDGGTVDILIKHLLLFYKTKKLFIRIKNLRPILNKKQFFCSFSICSVRL